MSALAFSYELQMAQELNMLWQHLQQRRPPADVARLSEAEVEAILAPLVRCYRDMDGTGRVSVTLFDVPVHRRTWAQVATLIEGHMRLWEHALAQHHGENGLSFVAELGYPRSLGVRRRGRSQKLFRPVDDAAVFRAALKELETIPFAMNGSGGLYLFDVRDAPIDGEYPIVFCEDAPMLADGWQAMTRLEPSFYECCCAEQDPVDLA